MSVWNQIALGLLLMGSLCGLHGAPAAKNGSKAAADTTAKPAAPNKGTDAAKENEAEEGEEEDLQEGAATAGLKRPAAVSTIDPADIAGFDDYAPQIQQVIRDALALTKMNLTYTFGSANPDQGGMDCSGTIVHLLQGAGIKDVPRQSDQICTWLADRTLLHRVTKAKSLTDVEFAALRPGDLVFWSGTYVTAPRTVPVTHVMLYLGKLKKNGKAVVFGASDGRVYEGKRRTGVSVFDFTLPRAGSKSSFYGYGLIPGVGKVRVKTPPPQSSPALPKSPAIAATLAAVTKVQAEPKEVTSAEKEVADKAAAKEEVRKATPATKVKAKSAATKKSSNSTKSAAAKKAKR